MRLSFCSWALLAVFAAPLLISSDASAEPVLDRALSDARVLEQKGCSVIRIGFNFRVRYQSHFPLDGGRELRVVVRPIDAGVAAEQVLVREESLRAPAVRQAAIASIEFDIGRPEGPTLSIYFRDPVFFKVGQGGDFTSIVVAISGAKPSANCRAEFPAGAASNAPAPKVVSAPKTAARQKAPLVPRSESERPSGKLSPEDRKEIAAAMSRAKTALTKKDLNSAIRLLTKVLGYPENESSAEAQELLGLARERNGQLAHARAEYETYLARYPDREGAARVRQRLAGLVTSNNEPKDKLREPRRQAGGKDVGRADAGETWSVSGSLSQFYYRDEAFRTIRDASLPPDPNEDPDRRLVYQNEALTGFDVVAKWENASYRSKFRFAGANEQGFDEAFDNESSVASLYLETSIKDWDVLTRVGRQTRNTGGVLGRFDGGVVSWQAREKVRFNAVVGAPVYSRRDLPFEDDQFFYGLSVDYGPIWKNLDTTWFFIDQQSEGFVDRQAIGAEFRYFDQTKSAFGSIDYDLHFNELNTAIFSSSWTLPDKSTIALGADYRKSPTLFTSNALQGQQIDNLRALLDIYTADEIRELALDRTATSSSATVGFSRPINEMLQVNADATWYNVSGTEASGDVEATPSTGDEYFYSAQLIGSNVVKDGDIFVAGVRYADRADSDIYVLDLNTRYPVTRGFRVNPRLRISERRGKDDDFRELSVLPSLRLNYDWTRDLSFEIEGGAKWSSREQDTITDKETEFFLIVGFRYDFYTDERGRKR